MNLYAYGQHFECSVVSQQGVGDFAGSTGEGMGVSIAVLGNGFGVVTSV